VLGLTLTVCIHPLENLAVVDVSHMTTANPAQGSRGMAKLR
jgi:hypothetical protein